MFGKPVDVQKRAAAALRKESPTSAELVAIIRDADARRAEVLAMLTPKAGELAMLEQAESAGDLAARAAERDRAEWEVEGLVAQLEALRRRLQQALAAEAPAIAAQVAKRLRDSLNTAAAARTRWLAAQQELRTLTDELRLQHRLVPLATRQELPSALDADTFKALTELAEMNTEAAWFAYAELAAAGVPRPNARTLGRNGLGDHAIAVSVGGAALARA
jgi:hypothetical protein